jgi:hypothetical protein
VTVLRGPNLASCSAAIAAAVIEDIEASEQLEEDGSSAPARRVPGGLPSPGARGVARSTASAMLGLTERKGVPGGGMKLWAAT